MQRLRTKSYQGGRIMGARINFVFKDDLDSAVVLYSHWGQTEWQRDLAMAMNHAKPRWTDSSYATRMMISYLMQDSILEETGFGIYSITGTNYDLGEQTVVIDLINHTVTDIHPVKWDNFIQAYLPEHAAV
jgi:hypothetical protein